MISDWLDINTDGPIDFDFGVNKHKNADSFNFVLKKFPKI